MTHYVLFVIEHATRAVHIAGITANSDGPFMAQVARNLTAHDDGFLRGKRYLVIDRDTATSQPSSGIVLPARFAARSIG